MVNSLSTNKNISSKIYKNISYVIVPVETTYYTCSNRDQYCNSILKSSPEI